MNDLTVLAAEINKHHQEAEAAAKTALEHARAAGVLLLKAKSQCAHGTWSDWLNSNFHGTGRTAQRYMAFARRWPELETKTTRVSDLSIREAIKLLTDPGPIDLDVEIHPAANIFPEFTGPGYEGLKQSIAEHGQHEPIVYHQGQLLDGRARLRACRELGIEPLECEIDDNADPVAFVLSKNLYRTHYTEKECQAAVAKAEAMHTN